MTAPANTPRRVVLRKLQPKCAERTAMLSPDPNIEPSMGYRRALRLPEDGLAVTAVIGVDDWIARGREIYIQQGAVDPPYAVVYTADTEILPDWLQKAIDARAAWDAFEADSGDPDVDGNEEVRLWNDWKGALAKAKEEDRRLALETAA